MIKNDHQLTISLGKVAALRESAECASEDWGRATYLDLASTIQEEIDEYRMVRDGSVQAFQIASLDDLPDAMVKARLSQRLTQAELAERLGVKEQMIQRYEDRGYERASLWKIAEVIDALGFELRGTLSRSRMDGDIRISDSVALPSAVRPSSNPFVGSVPSIKIEAVA